MERERGRETTVTTTYDTRTGMAPSHVVPVTVVEPARGAKAAGCINACATLQILLGLGIIALEAACVGLYYFLEESAVGIWVGIFAVIVGIVGLIAGRRTRSSESGLRRCCFFTELVLAVILAIKAFAFFCASAALLATAVQYYYDLRNGGGYGGGYGGAFGIFNNFPSYGGVNSGAGYYYSQPLETLIGLKAALMILYVLLFLTAVISAALSCVNCCRRRRHSKQQQVITVYPNGQPQVVHQQKI